MKIKLIEPSRYLANGKLLKAKQLFFSSLTLPLLAALTPKDIDISIVLEQFETIDFEEQIDLVGITSYTSRISRAYEIADEYRKRGVSVVMGGIHVSMEPEEALEHADTVIVGEAEETWKEFIKDFKNGNAQKMYVAKERPSLANLPIPRFSLVEKYESRYVVNQKRGLYHFLPTSALSIQTARGCPHSCDYCSVTMFSGRQYRTRPVPDVISEIRTLGKKAKLDDITEFLDFKPGERSNSGRLHQLDILYKTKEGEEKSFSIKSQYQIRNILHEKFLFSSAFVWDFAKDDNGKITKIILQGAGWGHGVGLCQMGALGMALKGYSYQDILKHYYNKTTLKKAY